MNSLRVAILTVSDRCARGLQVDASGPALADACEVLGWAVSDTAVVADEVVDIRRAVLGWTESGTADIILTTGGTGVGPRDVTPEALCPLFDKELKGFGEVMRLEGRRQTPLAWLSRGTAGTRGTCVIILLPGSPRGAVQNLTTVADLVPHVHHIVAGGAHPGAHRAASA